MVPKVLKKTRLCGDFFGTLASGGVGEDPRFGSTSKQFRSPKSQKATLFFDRAGSPGCDCSSDDVRGGVQPT
eukprot:918407-Amphidinium_carterae.1